MGRRFAQRSTHRPTSMCYRFSITVLLGLTLWVDSGQFLARDRNSCFVSRVNIVEKN